MPGQECFPNQTRQWQIQPFPSNRIVGHWLSHGFDEKTRVSLEWPFHVYRYLPEPLVQNDCLDANKLHKTSKSLTPGPIDSGHAWMVQLAISLNQGYMPAQVHNTLP